VELKNNLFEPTELGLGLYEGYNSMGFDITKPFLRAKMESDMKDISTGEKSFEEVIINSINMYKDLYVRVNKQSIKLENSVKKYLMEIGETGQVKIKQKNFSKCKCGNLMDLRSQNDHEFLFCNSCNNRNILSKSSDLKYKAIESICLNCDYQVLSVENQKSGKNYTICPHCFKNPPEDQIVYIYF
jgi:hypothetical protein